MCDNFYRNVADTLVISKRPHKGESVLMNQELEQEYDKLNKKVHDLREYL